MYSPEDWHNRFLQQARWTEAVRRFLFHQADLAHAESVLEVGCGSGAILADLTRQNHAPVIGIDVNLEFLRLAQNNAPESKIICGDGFYLPFADNTYTITFCHYFLLWLKNPLEAVKEMKRVTRPGGYVLALAEPDYGGRIDHPEVLVWLGQQQSRSLERQGANPLIGRKIKGLFSQAGLHNIQAGILGGQWGENFNSAEHKSEWDVLKTDLLGSMTENELEELEQIDLAAWQKGERILYVPTFYSWGKV
jgi:ubiquinone/menaquinone biosynthesis C-methylase UbiE